VSRVISVPQGGGALNGIRGKFSPDLFTGSGNFIVSITLSAGRNGFQPELSPAYIRRNGNGPFGLGVGPQHPARAFRTRRQNFPTGTLVPVMDSLSLTLIAVVNVLMRSMSMCATSRRTTF
jgi:hypothetical protein